MRPKPPPADLRPPDVQLDTTYSTSSKNAAARNRILLIIIGLLVVLALGVVFILPAQLDKKTQSQNNPLPSGPEENTKPPPLPQVQAPVQNPVAQTQAQGALQAFLRLRAQATFDNAEIWAANDWQKALAQADEGDALYGKGNFNAARANYEAATRQLTELQNNRPDILSSLYKTAQNLLQNNLAEQAITAFEKVLLMEEGHLQAQLGLTRSKVREAVLQQMQSGDQALAEDQLQIAKTAYNDALLLDPAYTLADIALQSVQETLDTKAYQNAMSTALDKLQSGKYNDAGKALDTAAELRPGSAEIKDARQSLKMAIKQARLNSLRSQSSEMAATEQWGKAAELYQQALAIEPQAGFALSGHALAQARLELHRQLDHYLNEPQRLASDEPLRNAQTLLKTNPSPPGKEPQLLAKFNSLKQAVEQAARPVSLVIESDDLTQISVYHVGQLGQFQRKQLTLRPGQYTLIGSRAGYRDVRKVINISPNTPLHLQLKCEEAI